MTRVRRCRVCRCTDARACAGGCSWVEEDLCSTCRAPAIAASLVSSASSEWRTPVWLAELLKKQYGPFDLDPAAAPGTSVGRRSYDRRDGGLEHPWKGKVYVNPPHARALGETVGPWILKALEELDAGHCELVVMLVPSRTDTSWWHELVMPRASAVLFDRGRLKFMGNDCTSPAPFPSVVIVFRRRRPTLGLKYLRISPASERRAVAKSEVTS